MHQLELLNKYSFDERERFNEELIYRTDEEIVSELLKVISSCQLYRRLKFIVKGYTIIDDPIEVQDRLYKYRQAQIDAKKKKDDNQYQYIPLKDSDIRLLIMNYYIQCDGDWDDIEVYIVIPKVVKKFYFNITGNMYMPLHQIIESSTYNNTTTKSTSKKKDSITLKTIFMLIKLYRSIEYINDIYGNPIECTIYTSYLFSKSINIFKYFLGKWGLHQGMRFLNLQYIFITDRPSNNPLFYEFNVNNVYITTPKELYHTEPVIQSFIYTILKSVNKDATYNDIMQQSYWIKSLGQEFGSFTEDKGISILDSFEGLYDISTIEGIMLPDEQKCSMYHLIRWAMYEFSNLKIKSNTDLSSKRLRTAPAYIAAFYADKLSKGIRRVGSMGARAKLSDVRKAVITDPWELMQRISKNGTLVTYKNIVHDNDASLALKFTLKGNLGVGENSNGTIPEYMRRLDPSELGYLDPDTSSPSDPGLSGVLCPYSQLTNKKFYNEPEPVTWLDNFKKNIKEFEHSRGIAEVMRFKYNSLGGDEKDLDQIEFLEETNDVLFRLVVPIVHVLNVHKSDDEVVIPTLFGEEEA